MKFDHSKKIHEQITPESWCQGHFYTDAEGSRVHSSKDATCACLVGWLKLKSGCRMLPLFEDTIKINKILNPQEECSEALSYPLYEYNDAHTFEEVKELLVKADL